jgi:hypothetical protein
LSRLEHAEPFVFIIRIIVYLLVLILVLIMELILVAVVSVIVVVVILFTIWSSLIGDRHNTLGPNGLLGLGKNT